MTTIFEALVNKDSAIQNTMDKLLEWSELNNMQLNPTKTKEILVKFGGGYEVDQASVDNIPVKRVKSAKGHSRILAES